MLKYHIELQENYTTNNNNSKIYKLNWEIDINHFHIYIFVKATMSHCVEAEEALVALEPQLF